MTLRRSREFLSGVWAPRIYRVANRDSRTTSVKNDTVRDRASRGQVLPFASSAAITRLTRETDSPSSFAMAVIVMPASR